MPVAPRRRPLWFRLGPGVVLALTVFVVLLTRWSPVVAGHPAYLLTLLTVGLVALALVGSALVCRVPAGVEGGPRGTTRPGVRSWVVRALGIVVAVALAAVLLWLRPLPADARAHQALGRGERVEVVQSRTRIELRPTGTASDIGVVFYPGAKVDPRAYVAVLRPLAEAGHLVVIVKPPYGIALTDPNAASSVIREERGVARWVVAGHSLGGTVAARYAGGDHPKVVGLLLWASYPAGRVAPARPLAVMSVFGTEDAVATPQEVLGAKPDLPADARFVPIDGAIHAFFGDYGDQRGDGTPTVDRSVAQQGIVDASLALLTSLG